MASTPKVRDRVVARVRYQVQRFQTAMDLNERDPTKTMPPRAHKPAKIEHLAYIHAEDRLRRKVSWILSILPYRSDRDAAQLQRKRVRLIGELIELIDAHLYALELSVLPDSLKAFDIAELHMLRDTYVKALESLR